MEMSTIKSYAKVSLFMPFIIAFANGMTANAVAETDNPIVMMIPGIISLLLLVIGIVTGGIAFYNWKITRQRRNALMGSIGVLINGGFLVLMLMVIVNRIAENAA